MKTFEKQAAQGDILISRVERIPDGLTERRPDRGEHVVAHSETGHHHAIATAGPSIVQLFGSQDPMTSFIRVSAAPAILQHKRPHDTHEALSIPPGDYEIRRQREHTPEGWRRVED